jgi:hypothetical protein
VTVRAARSGMRRRSRQGHGRFVAHGMNLSQRRDAVMRLRRILPSPPHRLC